MECVIPVYVCICVRVLGCLCKFLFILIAIFWVPGRDFSCYRKYEPATFLSCNCTNTIQSSDLLLANLIIVLISQNYPYLMLNKDENTIDSFKWNWFESFHGNRKRVNTGKYMLPYSILSVSAPHSVWGMGACSVSRSGWRMGLRTRLLSQLAEMTDILQFYFKCRIQIVGKVFRDILSSQTFFRNIRNMGLIKIDVLQFQ